MKMNKKAVSPVIAVMLLVAVAVAAVGAYFIWYKSFQAGSQKNVEEQTGTIGSKLRITNITNDNVTFYITIKNATGSDLIDGDSSPSDNQSNVAVVVKDSNGNTVINVAKVDVNTPPTTDTGSANFTTLVGTVGIANDEEGQIEAGGTSDIVAGETYTIIITAAGVTTTEKYTAI